MESQLVGQEFMAVDITKNYKIIKCDRLEHKYLYIDSENEHIGYMCMYIDTWHSIWTWLKFHCQFEHDWNFIVVLD